MITIVFSTVAAIGTGVVAVPPAWTALGLPRVATESYVDARASKLDIAQKAQEQVLNGIRLDIGNGRMGAIRQEQRRLQAELERTQDVNYKQNLRDSLQDLDIEAQELNAKLRVLRAN